MVSNFVESLVHLIGVGLITLIFVGIFVYRKS